MDNYKKKLSFSNVTAQIITIGLLFLFWQMGQKWVVVPASIILIFLLFFMPKIVARSEIRFHKKALKLLSTGKAAEVLGLARKQIILSVFGDSAPVDAKMGLAYAQIGNFYEASQYLENAIASAPQSELIVLKTAYIKSLFVTGEPAKAEKESKSIMDSFGIRLPEILIIRARARLASGRRDEETKGFLDEAAQMSMSKDEELMLKLTQIEFNMSIGKKAEDVPFDADSTQLFLRVWKNMVLGIQRERKGDIEKALSAYVKAEKEGRDERCWFADIAHMRIEAISAKNAQNNNNSETADNKSDKGEVKIESQEDLLLKKRKKRR
ncbi:MAG: hypothetical protein JXR91_10460 [Deltaproteobacteria bacterium]|nr:hypothetical protein [Deltaproteobacteria bacterium]